jgi:prolyl-tRNA editing enzyme YbaK/EbsC (Cys-tRNA(Pro) deacylase)
MLPECPPAPVAVERHEAVDSSASEGRIVHMFVAWQAGGGLLGAPPAIINGCPPADDGPGLAPVSSVIVHEAVREALADLGVSYETVPCDPSLSDTAAFCDAYGFNPEDCANCIVVASRRPAGQHVATLVLATTRLDVNGRCCELMGVRRASFAPPEQTAELTGMEIGGVTPFGLPEPLTPVWVDAAVLLRQRVVVGGGDRSVKLLVDSSVFSRAPLFEVVQRLAMRPTG